MRTLRDRVRDYVKDVSTAALRKGTAARRVEVFANDVFLVSYPRSGNTWARFLIGNLINPDNPVNFSNLEQRIPSIYTYPNRVLRRLPRILKSHECFDPRYPRVLYIVRDPRDVAISFYHFNIKMRRFTEEVTLDEFVTRFVAGKIHREVDQYGSWQDNVLSWTRMRGGRGDFCLVRYEDLLSDPIPQLASIAAVLGIDPKPERLRQAVQLSSADRMRGLEKRQGGQWVLTRNTRQDKPFVRAATSGEWKTTLSEASTRAIEQAWSTTMEAIGYKCSLPADAQASPQTAQEGERPVLYAHLFAKSA